ncbi:porin [Undibacterium oligocarboniphilum]|uniref:Porin n=1 Tax=Undibacterium oligocarboniphilum TaxID=666702 RepID=A0A850QJE5_9BURK|nr:porin [Undibacterium oligocarboniphilum]MBC3869998.1 porin [Undibacterium oligocarboniphilum]NVO77615.1 porin [Undibacterium oligocarboniphilum]
MKKSLLAFAILGAFAATASAQSSVTLYGIVDAATVYTTNQTASGGSKIAMDPGQLLTSRWGVKGSEDLGGGLKAIFNLEGTLFNDTGVAGAGFGGNVFNQGGNASSLFDRLSWVGLSGDFGTVTFGRNNILGVDSVGLADPIGLAHAGSNPNVMFGGMNSGALYGGFGTNQGGTALRQNNSIKYVSPITNGFGGALMYGFGEKAGDTGASSYMGASGFFTDGTNGAAVAYAKMKDFTNTATLTAWAAGAKYKVDPAVVLRATYAQDTVDGNIVIAPFGNANNRKIKVIGLGVDYLMSPQTTITGAYYGTKRSGDVVGKADQYIGLVKYAFSKRTTAYASLTYAKAGSTSLQDTSLALGIIGNLANQDHAVRTAVGILHAF